jgi:hypothetical protein
LQLFEALASAVGLKTEVSSAGIYTRSLIQKLGGLDAAAEALSDTTRNALLHAYRSDSPSGKEPGDLIEGRRYLSLADVRTLTGLSEVAAVQLLDDYASRGILFRGVALRCEHCRFCGWYRLDDLQQTFNCRRCRLGNAIRHATWSDRSGLPYEPMWQYELDELLYLALKNDSRAPVLALRKIKGSARDFLFAPEMDISDSSTGKRIAEVDILALDRGRVVVGEAKTVDRLGNGMGEKKAVGRLLHVANKLNADQVVVATTRPSWHSFGHESRDRSDHGQD